MMVPSYQNASFMLVTESGLAVYEDVLSSKMVCWRLGHAESSPKEFVGSCRRPLWAQWAKPRRHSRYLETNDDFFLVREDGQLQYFEIKHGEPTKFQTQSSVGELGVAVDSAFAILDGPQGKGGDICVVGGDMNDGLVCHVRARAPLDPYQKIMNLAPITDLLILESPNGDENARRMFVCSGKGKNHATLAEIRRGLEAKVGSLIEDDDFSTATALWALQERSHDQITFVMSYPTHTTVFRMASQKHEPDVVNNSLTDPRMDIDSLTDPGMNIDSIADQGMDMNSPTLALASLEGDFKIQITPEAAVVLSPHSNIIPFRKRHTNGRVLLAQVNAELMLFGTAAMVQDRFQVSLSAITAHSKTMSIHDCSEAYMMVDEPSSMLMFGFKEMELLVVGTIIGTIHILAIIPHQGVRLISQHHIGAIFPDLEAGSINSLSFLTNSKLELPALACGTRNGWVLGLTMLPNFPLRMALEESKPGEWILTDTDEVPRTIDLKPHASQRLGRTSVELIPDSGNLSAVLGFCNSDLHRVTLSVSEWDIRFEFCRIWLTDDKQVSSLA